MIDFLPMWQTRIVYTKNLALEGIRKEVIGIFDNIEDAKESLTSRGFVGVQVRCLFFDNEYFETIWIDPFDTDIKAECRKFLTTKDILKTYKVKTG